MLCAVLNTVCAYEEVINEATFEWHEYICELSLIQIENGIFYLPFNYAELMFIAHTYVYKYVPIIKGI